MNKRELKGNSILNFSDNYVVIDIETTGLSPEHDSIIELAGIRYSSDKEMDRFSSLVRPPKRPDGLYVDNFISSFTGISNEMLNAARTIDLVLPEFISFLGDSLVVGHNVNFDINFIYDNCMRHLNKPLCNDFVDTMRVSRNLHPEEQHHTLSDLTERYSVEYSCAHRALRDCELTHSVLVSLISDASTIYGSYDDFLLSVKQRRKKHYVKASDIHSSVTDFDITHPLYGKVCVFTGALEKMIRREAMQLVIDHGGINGDSVTKKTNFLILGNNDYCASIKDGKSSKHKKAEQLKLKGQDIEIIPEDVFYDMLDI